MLVYGKNVAEAILKNEKLLKKVRKIYIQDNFSGKIENSLGENAKFRVEIAEKKKMDHLSDGVHQGIILDMEDYQYSHLSEVKKKNPSFLVLLDHLEDPHNLGAIIRTCVAAGVDAILLPHNRQVGITPAVVKSSVGTLYDIDIVEVVNLKQTIDELKQDGFWFVGTDLTGEDYRTIDYRGKIALIIGNEGKGMSRLVKESCDFMATIPMQNGIDSLNASVASGIMIYEVVRNRK